MKKTVKRISCALPALLLLCDRLICATTAGMKQKQNDKVLNQEVYVK